MAHPVGIKQTLVGTVNLAPNDPQAMEGNRHPITDFGLLRLVERYRAGLHDDLQFGDIEKPTICDDEVLIRVRAAGVDRGVWHLMTGLPYLGRLALGLRKPKDRVLGMDVAGIVEAVGKNVTVAVLFAPYVTLAVFQKSCGMRLRVSLLVAGVAGD